MSETKDLVVALDGLDKELIDKFSLDNVKQKEYGSIDNNFEGITTIKTSELFATFITGETHEEHGIEGITLYNKPKTGNFLDKILGWPEENLRGGYRLRSLLDSLLDIEKRRPREEDLECETIFNEVDNSRAIFIPSYNPDPMSIVDMGMMPLKYGYGEEDTAKFWRETGFEWRKRELFSELDNGLIPARDFLMIHFFIVDHFQHLYGDKTLGNYDEDKLRKLYREMDELAGEIKEKALEKGYDRVIFMSDHGIPEGDSHNENAFYSCNEELFWDRTPKLTDFYPKFLG
jgi:hypothetical protein